MRPTLLGVKILKLVPVLALCWVSEGCVGAYVWRTRSTTINNPVIENAKALDGVSQRCSNEAANRFEYTASWLEAHWGKPGSIRIPSSEAGVQIWTYRFSSSWCGVIPMVIVPIPLVLPVGREKIVFVMRAGQVVSAERFEFYWGGAGAGLVGPPDGAPWAGAW